MEDDLFKNLTIVDIEELLRDTATPKDHMDQDSPIIEVTKEKKPSTPKKQQPLDLTDEHALLLHRDSDNHFSINEFDNMDFE